MGSLIRVNMVGTGRVGRAMMRLMARRSGLELVGIAGRNLKSARDAAADLGLDRLTCNLAELPDADLFCLAVPDDAIAGVAAEIQALGHEPSTAIHFSGYHPASSLAALEGWSLASAHPNLSFANPEHAARRFPGTHVALEGDAAAVELAEKVMLACGARCFRIKAEDKPLYHGAAVIANNFPVVLQALAREVWARAGVPDEIGAALGKSLLRAAVDNLDDATPAEALTGPAARADDHVVWSETESLGAWRADAADLYAELSRMARRLKVDGRTGD